MRGTQVFYIACKAKCIQRQYRWSARRLTGTGTRHSEDAIVDPKSQEGVLSGLQLLSCCKVIMAESAVTAESTFEEACVNKIKLLIPSSVNKCISNLLQAAPLIFLQHAHLIILLDDQFVLDQEGHGLAELLCMCDDNDHSSVDNSDDNDSLMTEGDDLTDIGEAELSEQDEVTGTTAQSHISR